MQPKPRQIQFSWIELVEALAEVEEHQVAFVSQQRKERRLAIGFALHLGKKFRGFGGDLAAGVFRERAPCRPAKAHHLVKGGVAFDRQRYSWELPGGHRQSFGMGWV